MIRRSLIALAMLGLAALSGPAQAQSGCAVPKDAAAMAAQALDQVNAERRAKGLAALRNNPSLARAASDHSCFMARTRQLTHQGQGGQKIGPRARGAGYNYRTVAENVAHGHKTPASVVSGWMTSAPHRKSILRGELRDAGLAVRAAGDGAFYWTLVMAQPR